MSNAKSMEQQTFKVVCVWCGDVIRFNHSKNSQGMCMKCHARMLRDYNLAHMQRDASLRASER